MEIQFTLKVVHYGRDECYLFDESKARNDFFTVKSIVMGAA